MPTPLQTATPTVPAGQPPPLLMGHDLDDADQFVTVRRVPLLDAHTDPEHGTVDEPLLRLIARNSNTRVAKGHYPALTLGHTRPKQTVTITDGDRKITRPGSDELDQPPVAGYATAFHVADFDGRPCLHADFHINKRDADYARSFPFRSVERLEPNADPDADQPPDPSAHVVDRIALLRTAPRRDLGVLRYEQSASPASPFRRICYARDFPHFAGGVNAPGSPPGPPADSIPDPSPDPSLDPPPPSPTSTPGEPAMADTAIAPAPAPAEAPASAPEPKLMDMTASQFSALIADAMTNALSAAMDQPEDDAPAPDDATQYEANETLDPEAEEAPMNYESAAEPGGDNTIVPAVADRKLYERFTTKVGKDQREQDEMLVALSDRLLEMEHRERRHNYEKRLRALADEDYALDDPAITEHLAELKPDAPVGYEAEQEQRIRKHYARRPSGNRSPVPVAGLSISPPADGGITVEDRQKAIAFASRNPGTSFTDALKAVRGK